MKKILFFIGGVLSIFMLEMLPSPWDTIGAIAVGFYVAEGAMHLAE